MLGHKCITKFPIIEFSFNAFSVVVLSFCMFFSVFIKEAPAQIDSSMNRVDLIGMEITSETYGNYTQLVKQVKGMSSEKIINMGDKSLENNDLSKAMVLYMVVCNKFADDISEQERQACAIAYRKVGNVYYMNGSYTYALEMYIEGLKIYEQCKDQHEIAGFYNNIGNIYGVFLEYEKGIEYYEKGYSYSQKYNDKRNGFNLLVNMAYVWLFLNNIEKAKQCHALSKKLIDKNNPENCYSQGFSSGLILISEKKYDRAAEEFRALYSYAVRNKMDPQYQCSSLLRVSQAYKEKGNVDSAFYYLTECYDAAVRYNISNKFLEIFDLFSELCKQRGDKTSAQMYKVRYLTMRDSVFNRREFDAVKNIQFQYEMSKINREIAALYEQDKEKQQTIIRQWSIMGGIIIIVVIVIVFLIIIYRQKKELDDSYRNLYIINNGIVDDQEKMKSRYKVLSERLEKVMAENEMLRNVQDSIVSREVITDLSATAKKYQSSNLSSEQKERLLDAIIDVMENTLEFCSEDFSLDRMAQLVNSNSKYVSQVINDAYEKNFTNYVNEYRIRLACIRLTDMKNYGNYTIKAIAEGLGFKSQNTFTNVFRKVTGMTPSIYQKMAKQSIKV